MNCYVAYIRRIGQWNSTTKQTAVLIWRQMAPAKKLDWSRSGGDKTTIQWLAASVSPPNPQQAEAVHEEKRRKMNKSRVARRTYVYWSRTKRLNVLLDMMRQMVADEQLLLDGDEQDEYPSRVARIKEELRHWQNDEIAGILARQETKQSMPRVRSALGV